jgi:hypothetical protein
MKFERGYHQPVRRPPGAFFMTAVLFMFFSQTLCVTGSTNTVPCNGKAIPLAVMDAQSLMKTRDRIHSGDSLMLPTLEKLRKEADAALQEGLFSVMDKTKVPPSGDKHDYMSVAMYWFPDPNTPNGLPYVRRDGVVTPEVAQYDFPSLSKMTRNVAVLSLAYFFTERPAYAEHAVRLLRTWFVDPKTRMNPHLNYSQSIRGIDEGRAAGIIDTWQWVHLVDPIALLTGSAAWSETEQAELKNWFRRYLAWLLESKNGRTEARKKNNHGTWYEVQVAAYALYTGERATAQHFIGRLHNRIAFQIQQNGTQPAELSRTRAFHYSVMNLEGLCHAAFMGEQLGFDLWHFRAEDGGGISTALDFLLPFALHEKEWPYQQITDWQEDLELFALLLRRARDRDPEMNDSKREGLFKAGESRIENLLYH